jgi:hypothetical protein
MLRGLGDRRVMMDLRQARTLSGAVVASMADLARIFALVYTLEMGRRKVEVFVAGAISGFCRGVGDGCGRGTRPRLILYRCASWWFLVAFFGGFSL